MPNKYDDLTLEGNLGDQTVEFKAVLTETDIGILLVIGNDDHAKTAWKNAKSACNGSLLKTFVKAVWAKNPDAVKTEVKLLTGGDLVNWTDFGTRIVAINMSDVVCRALDRNSSDFGPAVLSAAASAASRGNF